MRCFPTRISVNTISSATRHSTRTPGSAGGGGFGFDGFGDLGDIFGSFGDIFGFGGGGQRANPNARAGRQHTHQRQHKL